MTLQGSSRDAHLVARIISALEESVCPASEDIAFMQESLRSLLAGARPEPTPLVSHALRLGRQCTLH